MHKAINSKPIKNNSGYAVHVGKTPYLLGSLNQGLPATATGSVVVNGTHTDPSISAGEFAHNHIKPIAKRITTEIAGLSSNVILSGASVPYLTKSIHKIEEIITTKQCTSYRNGDFNYFTGKYVVNPDTVLDIFHKSISSETHIDTAANASRNNTGKLVYLVGSARPSSKAYATKTA